MAKVHDNRAYKHGLFAGWKPYRYGDASPNERRVYNPAKRRQPTIPNEIIDMTASALREWAVNPWEAEGDIRTILRSTFIDAGVGWQLADDLAAEAIHKAFVRLGRGLERRPHDDEGQLEWTRMGGDYCLGCGQFHLFTYDELTIRAQFSFRTAHYLFCSTECAERVIKRRGYVKTRVDPSKRKGKVDAVGRAAESMLERSESESRVCARDGCGHPFKPRYDWSEQKFCSPACQHKAAKTIQARTCKRKDCGKTFTPPADSRVYCCKSCENADRQNVFYLRECQWCHSTFQANGAKAKFCCHAHAAAHHRADSGHLPLKLSGPAFDFVFKVAA